MCGITPCPFSPSSLQPPTPTPPPPLSPFLRRAEELSIFLFMFPLSLLFRYPSHFPRGIYLYFPREEEDGEKDFVGGGRWDQNTLLVLWFDFDFSKFHASQKKKRRIHSPTAEAVEVGVFRKTHPREGGGGSRCGFLFVLPV